MKIINLFGVPGSGKSTVASGLFYKFKTSTNLNVELVTEYAKDIYWEERKLPGQFYISAKQNLRFERLEGKVDIIVADSPLLLGLVYRAESYPKSFDTFLLDMFNSYNNINYYLNMGVSDKYQTVGRWQTWHETAKLENKILESLINNNILFSQKDVNDKTVQIIFDEVCSE